MADPAGIGRFGPRQRLDPGQETFAVHLAAALGLVGHDTIRGEGLTLEHLAGQDALIAQPQRIDQGQSGPRIHHRCVAAALQNPQDLVRMPEAGRFDEQAPWPSGEEQIERHLHRQAVDAAQAAASHFLDQRAVAVEDGSVDPDLAKLVDKNRPGFGGRFAGQQMQNRGGLADTQEAGDQVDGDPGGRSGIHARILRSCHRFGLGAPVCRSGGASFGPPVECTEGHALPILRGNRWRRFVVRASQHRECDLTACFRPRNRANGPLRRATADWAWGRVPRQRSARETARSGGPRFRHISANWTLQARVAKQHRHRQGLKRAPGLGTWQRRCRRHWREGL